MVEATDQRGQTTTYRFDDRNLIVQKTDPNGGLTRYGSDAHGNLVELVMPNGATWRWKWDYFGRPVEREDPRGGLARCAYSDSGRLLSLEEPGGRTIRFEWDAMGCYTARHDELGTTLYEWGGLRWLASMTQPNGDQVRYRFNREGWVLKVVNERGEATEYEYNDLGLATKIQSFDGAIVRNGWDNLGRLIWTADASGSTEIVRDIGGRVVEIQYPDDTIHTCEYNLRDEVVRSTAPGVEVTQEFDPVGNVVRETQTLWGEEHSVSVSYDSMQQRSVVSTSLGFLARYERDVAGAATKLMLGKDAIQFTRDATGMPVREALPDGGLIESAWDEGLRLIRRRALSNATAVSRDAREPVWVGETPGNVQCDHAYQYAKGSKVVASWDYEKGPTGYAYDARGRLAARIVNPDTSSEIRQSFYFDATSNLHEAGAPQRRYATGNRLLEQGNVTFEWDSAGRLVKRIRGQTETVPGEVTGYEWNGQGLLSAVELPDGKRVEFTYDSFWRRLGKRKFRRGDDGGLILETQTRFVWDGNAMVRQRRWSTTGR